MTAVPLDCAALQVTGLASGSGSVAWTTATATPAPSPSPSLSGNLEPGDVSPGLIGFLPVFLIALACIGLFLSLTNKLRGVNRRQAQIDAEEAAAAASGASADDAPDDAGR
ncbi:hypothetical protein [Pengzhenrongella phosphoraccumulans]|uniref:hypothetical protein n=1 Tax=Pengzhenrongella phosphoraccumulans TaxID=3114394 RepID=UPI00388F7956